MGKGTIKSGGTDGQYQVTIRYNRVEYEKRIAIFTKKIAALEDQIATAEASMPTIYPELGLVQYPEYNRAMSKLNSLKMQKASVEKQKTYLEDHFPADYDISAWCADFSEDMAAGYDVKTIEVPGEVGTIQIAPGYHETTPGTGAAYDISAGQMMPSVTCSPAQAYLAMALLPGYQKWKPTYRYGTITAKDDDANTANVTLEDIRSSQQDIVINQTETLENVTVDYMDCNSQAFEVDDSVLIKFTGHSWDNPVVIGFKDNPKPCATECLLIKVEGSINKAIVILCETGELATKIADGNGGYLSFPCNVSELDYWLSHSSSIAQKQNDYWTRTDSTEERGPAGYESKLGSSSPPPYYETVWCDSDELMSTWSASNANLVGDITCYQSKVGSIGSTYANLESTQERIYGETYYPPTGATEDCVYGGNRLISAGDASVFVYTPNILFDNYLPKSIEVINGSYRRTSCLPYEAECGPSIVTDDSLCRYTRDAIETMTSLTLDFEIIATEKSCVQLFKLSTVTEKKGTYLKDWVILTDWDCYTIEFGPPNCNWISEEYRTDCFESGFSEYKSLSSYPSFEFSAAFDYKADTIEEEGYDPKTATKNDIITNFVNQCSDEVGGDFSISWLSASFRTQRS